MDGIKPALTFYWLTHRLYFIDDMAITQTMAWYKVCFCYLKALPTKNKT
jgi:hypothetical protein